MSEIKSYISTVSVFAKTDNDDVITVSTEYLSPEGDVFTLDKRTLAISAIQTTQSLNELQPEISTVYPYIVTVPVDMDGANILYVSTVNTSPTASQYYYPPLKFERYTKSFLENLDRTFMELTTGSFSIADFGTAGPITIGEV